MLCTSKHRQDEVADKGGKRNQAECVTKGQTTLVVGECKQPVLLCLHCERDQISGLYRSQVEEALKLKHEQRQRRTSTTLTLVRQST